MEGRWRYKALVDWKTPSIAMKYYKRLDGYRFYQNGEFVANINVSFAVPGTTAASELSSRARTGPLNDSPNRVNNPPPLTSSGTNSGVELSRVTRNLSNCYNSNVVANTPGSSNSVNIDNTHTSANAFCSRGG